MITTTVNDMVTVLDGKETLSPSLSPSLPLSLPPPLPLSSLSLSLSEDQEVSPASVRRIKALSLSLRLRLNHSLSSVDGPARVYYMYANRQQSCGRGGFWRVFSPLLLPSGC